MRGLNSAAGAVLLALAQTAAAQPPVSTLRVITAEPAPGQPEQSEEEYEAEIKAIVEKDGMWGLVTRDMSQEKKLVLCGLISGNYTSIVASTPDPGLRSARLGDAWLLEARISPALAEAKSQLGESGYQSASREAGQAIALLSMAPAPSLKAEIKAGEDVMLVFMRSLSGRCHEMLDTMEVPQLSGEPPAEYIEKHTRFRYRGDDYEAIFADTGLAPLAAKMCRGEAPPDIAGAALDRRGKHGMSLIDWAMECEDKPAFDALIAAGMDLEASGLWEDPPMVRAATEKRIWYLTRLLDSGASPDAMGRTTTALREATSDLDAINFGGDTRAAFNLLRSRGASLNFPDFPRSMWFEWGLHETRWDLILHHWDEFDSDPVSLGDLLEGYLSGDWAWAKEEHKDAAREVKARLIAEHGVCFPVGDRLDMEKDERGYAIQPDCPKRD